MIKTVAVPEGHGDSVFVVSVSGGKDSTASMLALREAGIEARYVFADTGWEARETYEHLVVLERVLGITIERVGVPGGMRAKILERAGFPTRLQRWCTSELKVQPLREYHHRVTEETGRDTVSFVGIRAEESATRAAMPAFGYDDRWDGYVWRPVLDWSIEDVLAIHHRHAVPVHPHYKLGHNRVGCWPCIYASKEGIRLWAEHDPARVEEVAELERECERLRVERNAVTPGRYAHAEASFFQSRKAVTREGKRVYLPMHVGDVVEWSRTGRGGKQGLLIRDDPDSGCFRWGMCEPPTRE